eukprot:1488275-Amphidinium_carterae.1
MSAPRTQGGALKTPAKRISVPSVWVCIRLCIARPRVLRSHQGERAKANAVTEHQHQRSHLLRRRMGLESLRP